MYCTEGGGSEHNNGVVIGVAASALIVISTLIIVIIILLMKMQRYKKYVVQHNVQHATLVTIIILDPNSLKWTCVLMMLLEVSMK